MTREMHNDLWRAQNAAVVGEFPLSATVSRRSSAK